MGLEVLIIIIIYEKLSNIFLVLVLYVENESVG